MTFLEFLIKIQGLLGAIIGVIIGFILNEFAKRGEVYAFVHNENIQITPKGKKQVAIGPLVYANVDNVEDAKYGGSSLNIEIINEASFPRKIKIDKIALEAEGDVIIGDIISIDINRFNYYGESFITLKPNDSVKGKFHIEIIKEDLIKSVDKNINGINLIGHDSKRNKIDIGIY